MARYLVTGVAGFIGSKVAESLLAGGDDVVGVDNLNDAYDTRLKEWRLGQLRAKSGFSFHLLDICDRQHLEHVFAAEFEAVLHLAARAGVRQSVENPWVYFDTNVIGTVNLLELCRSFGVTKFVQASTSSLYGSSDARPFREDADTERPLSPYAASKKSAEALCYTYHYLHQIDVTVLRYFTVYGPAGRPDMSLFRFVQWIAEGRPVVVYGDGGQERDFTYVDDIARGTIAALTRVGYEIINLGSDRPIILNDAISLVERLLGRRAKVEHQPRHPADVSATWADITKARRTLSWQPQTTFEDGVTRMVEWYQAHRSWVSAVRT